MQHGWVTPCPLGAPPGSSQWCRANREWMGWPTAFWSSVPDPRSLRSLPTVGPTRELKAMSGQWVQPAGGEGPARGHRERAPMLDPRARGGKSPRPPTQDRGQQSGAAPGALHPAESSVGYGSHWFSRRCKTGPSSTPRPVGCRNSALPRPARTPSPRPQHRPILRGPSAWSRALTCGQISSGDCGSSRGLGAGLSGLRWVGEGLRVRARPHRAFYTLCDPSGLL